MRRTVILTGIILLSTVPAAARFEPAWRVEPYEPSEIAARCR